MKIQVEINNDGNIGWQSEVAKILRRVADQLDAASEYGMFEMLVIQLEDDDGNNVGCFSIEFEEDNDD